MTDYELSMQPPEPTPPQPVYRGPKLDWQLSALLPGRQYGLRVRAHNRAGAGHWSEQLQAQTAAGVPEPPSRLRLANGALPSSLQLAWDAPAHNNGAHIIEYRLLKAVRRYAQCSTCFASQFCPCQLVLSTLACLAVRNRFSFLPALVSTAGRTLLAL